MPNSTLAGQLGFTFPQNDVTGVSTSGHTDDSIVSGEGAATDDRADEGEGAGSAAVAGSSWATNGSRLV